jgi:hypothetical protein
MAHIRNVIHHCEEAGLRIVASVSDQGATNVSVVNQLVQGSGTGRHDARHLKKYDVRNQSVIHIYDSPHLLKGIRNNLMKRDVYWEREGDLISARWDDIIYAYEADNTSGELRSMPKMTDGHVYVAKMKKIKVSCAAQVFNHSVASFMAVLSRIPSEGMDPQNLKDTATILKFFDRLFDSVNASTLFNKSRKEYKWAASVHSGHIPFWREARGALQNMFFKNLQSGQREVPPSLKN